MTTTQKCTLVHQVTAVAAEDGTVYVYMITNASDPTLLPTDYMVP